MNSSMTRESVDKLNISYAGGVFAETSGTWRLVTDIQGEGLRGLRGEGSLYYGVR